MRFSSLVVAVLLSLVAVLPLAAAEPPKLAPTRAQAIELARTWMDVQRAYDGIPAMSAAIVRDQELIWSGASGLADPVTNRAATTDTLYSICSISKLFTSIGVMQLRDAGKLSLDDPLSKHLPWFGMKQSAESGDFTVGGVLTHSSGLPRESDYPYWTGEFAFPTREQIIERVSRQEPLYASDSYFQYSNLGLTLAGEVVRAASGMPYDQYIRENVLTPLRLSSTFPEMPEAEKGKRLAIGYSARRRDGTRAALPFFKTSGIAPAAGFASSVNDLAKFASWQFRLLGKGGEEVLKARTLREMHRPHFVDPDMETFWGLGFAVMKRGENWFVGHGGSCPGFRSDLMLKTDDKVGVVVMANASGVNTGGYARAIYEIVAPTLKADESKIEPDKTLNAYTGSYDEFPWGGEELFFVWGNELVSTSLPTMEPLKEPTKYRRSGEHKFRRVRKDGTLGETLTFDMDANGRAVRVWQHSNPSSRIR